MTRLISRVQRLLYYGLLACTATVFAGGRLAAQDAVPELATDRLDRTEASSLVPVGALQVEIGVETEHVHITDNTLDQKQITTLYPTVLLRYGLLPSWELRVVVEHQEFRYAGESVRGLTPLSIGSKFAVCSEEGWRPELALIGHLTLPYLGQEDFRPSFISPRFRFAAGHTLSDVLSFGYNLGLEWDGESALATGIYTVVLGAGLGEQFGVFAEVFGSFPEVGDAAHSLNGGATWLPLPTLQFDASGSIGLTETAPEFTVGAGVSFRLLR